MLIADDSPLRRLPPELNRKQALFFDGIRYSIEMADLAHTRLLQILHDLAVNRDNLQRGQLPFVPAFLDAWSMVDSIHRLRGLVSQAPGIKQKSTGAQVFRTQTKVIEDLRNSVQHLNTQIHTIADQGLPVWGVLSWFFLPDSESRWGLSCALVSGTVSPAHHSLVNPLGKNIAVPIDLITLTAHGHSVCLSEVMRHVKLLTRGIEKALKEKFANSSQAGSDVLVFVEMAFGNTKSGEAT